MESTRKNLKDISWNVDEPTYRADSALSYSTLARFAREGFNKLDSLFTPIELGARILYLELEEKYDLSFKLSMAVLDRWKDVHFYASNNAMKIIIKHIDRVENKDEILKKILEKIEIIESLHPDYNSTKKVRFELLMLDKKYKEAEEKIKEVLFRMMKDIKQDFENQIPTSPLIMVESMKDMLKTVPRDKRRSTKRDIVNYISRQMEKQCKTL